MKKKMKLIILVSIVLLLALIAFLFIHHQALKNDDESKIIVKNGLSINYIDGDKVSSFSSDKKYVFSITNDSTDDRYYVVELEDFKSNKSINYKLSCEETKINVEDGNFENNTLVEYAIIHPGETHNYLLTVGKYVKKFDVGIITVNNYTFEQEYFAQTVISNNTVSQNPKTGVGVEVSQTDEGLIQDLDDDGITYYFRGDVQNNYVKFADLTWRIVRINGNNTVRLILNDTTEEMSEYYKENSNNYFAYNNTTIKSYLLDWYKDKLSNYDKYIITSRVCDNSSYTGSEEYIFQSSQRLTVNHNPTFNCLGTKLNSKISLLTADEVEYAGGVIGLGNNQYYLYNSNILNPVWTMTPAKGNKDEFYPYVLSISGSLDDTSVGSSKRSVRPVINIRKDISVTGKGTIDEPYELLF